MMLKVNNVKSDSNLWISQPFHLRAKNGTGVYGSREQVRLLPLANQSSSNSTLTFYNRSTVTSCDD